jgi:hypothetical protein
MAQHFHSLRKKFRSYQGFDSQDLASYHDFDSYRDFDSYQGTPSGVPQVAADESGFKPPTGTSLGNRGE